MVPRIWHENGGTTTYSTHAIQVIMVVFMKITVFLKTLPTYKV